MPDEFDPFRCGFQDCDSKNIIPAHLRNIWCAKCNKFFHVKCTDTNTRQYNLLKNDGKVWLCKKCRPYVKSEKCGSCKKPIHANNLIIWCSECKKFFHSGCSKISFAEFNRMTFWSCHLCTLNKLPFYEQNNEELFLTMQGKDEDFSDNIVINPCFTIQSLLDNISGEGQNNENNYIFDLTHSQYFTPSEFLTSKFSKESFSMFHINIASLSCHIDDLKTLLSILDHPFDIIAVSETKIKEDQEHVTNFSIPGYEFKHTPTKSDFGGVGIFYKNTLDFIVRDDLSKSIFNISESLFLEISSEKSKNFLIGCIYRHHTPIESFQRNFFENSLIKISNEKKKVALLGDFNIDLLKTDSDDKTSEFYNFLSGFGFRPLILQPTRVQTTTRSTSASLIDNIFVNDFENISTGGNITATISDHFPQFCSIPGFFGTPDKPPKVDRFGRSFKNFSHIEFTNEIKSINWTDLFRGKNTNQCISVFVEKIDRLMDEMAPLKKLTKREIGLKQRPWINSEILSLMKERDNIHKSYLRENDICKKNIIFGDYKRKRNEIVERIRLSKNKHYADFFDENKSNTKKIWEGIRDIVNISKKNPTTPSEIIYKNKSHTNSIEMAKSFNDFFVNIGNKVEEKIPHTDVHFSNFLSKNNDSIFSFQPVGEEEISIMISQLNTSKSCGPNSVPTKLLKDNTDIFSSPLKHIINLSFEEGCFPDMLKVANVCPIYKKKCKKKCENYRPISLLPNLSKLFERAMHSRLYEYLENNHLLYDLQFGFRKKNSTVHALLDIVDKIRENLDNKTFSCGVFIDLEKAFDTVNHNILLQKLQFYGILGKNISWFTSYLSNRKQRVKINSQFSPYADISCGVPQGSILGPLLFLIYINDMKNSTKHSIVHHFADDTNLLCSERCEKLLKRKLNEDLKLIYTWLCANRLSLNVDKTEFIVFRPPRQKLDCRFTLKLNQKTLFESTKIKYLGMILDSSLSWKHHIFELRKKLGRAIGIIYKMKKLNCPQNILLSLYHSLFHSHMGYGICLYGLAKNDYTSKIFLLQKRVIRLISNAAFTAHSKPLFDNLKILTLEKAITLQLAQLMWEHDHGDLPPCFQNYFQKTSDVHQYPTRSSNQNKLAQNIFVNTDLHGKKRLKYIGPRIFNKIVNLNFYKTCKNKCQFKRKMKDFLLNEHFAWD